MPRPPARPLAAALLLLALTLAAAAPAAGAEAAAEPSTAAGIAAAPTWHQSLEPAVAAARASGKPLLVDLYADWCGWCHRLEAEVFSSPRFAERAADFVLLRVDVEDGAEGAWLRRRLGVATLPTLAILDADLVRLGLVDGYAPTERYLLKIDRALVAHDMMRQRDLERAASDDRATLRAVGRELLGRQDGAAAAAVYDKLLAAPGLPPAERAELLLWRADAERLARRYDRAAATLAEARSVIAGGDAANPKLHDALDLGVLRLAEDRGGCTGVAVLEDFLRQRAKSRHASRAKSDIAELKAGPAQNCS
jgi:thioredoxin-like negative regulator of GroEL